MISRLLTRLPRLPRDSFNRSMKEAGAPPESGFPLAGRDRAFDFLLTLMAIIPMRIAGFRMRNSDSYGYSTKVARVTSSMVVSPFITF